MFCFFTRHRCYLCFFSSDIIVNLHFLSSSYTAKSSNFDLFVPLGCREILLYVTCILFLNCCYCFSFLKFISWCSFIRIYVNISVRGLVGMLQNNSRCEYPDHIAAGRLLWLRTTGFWQSQVMASLGPFFQPNWKHFMLACIRFWINYNALYPSMLQGESYISSLDVPTPMMVLNSNNIVSYVWSMFYN